MARHRCCLNALVLALWASTSLAQTAVPRKAETCIVCHGPNGNSTTSKRGFAVSIKPIQCFPSGTAGSAKGTVS